MDPLAATVPRLRICSWNIWFDTFEREARLLGVFGELRARQLDVVCLQEVVPAVARRLHELLARAGLAGEYATSDDACGKSGASVAPYGVLVLCRRALLPEFRIHELPTHMDRRLVTCTIAGSSGSGGGGGGGGGHRGEGGAGAGAPQMWAAVVGSVHLESLNSAALRRGQLAAAAVKLSELAALPHPHPQVQAPVLGVLCGDFNFDDRRNFGRPVGEGPLENSENMAALAERGGQRWHDAWLQHRPAARAAAEAAAALAAAGGAPLAAVAGGEREAAALEAAEEMAAELGVELGVEAGFTFDTEANSMLTSWHPGARYRLDRLVLTNYGGVGGCRLWRTASIDRVGTEAIRAAESESRGCFDSPPRAGTTALRADAGPNPTHRLFCSDHFGLVASLELLPS